MKIKKKVVLVDEKNLVLVQLQQIDRSTCRSTAVDLSGY